MMLDHQYRIAGIDQMVERVEQALNIGQVQARGRLVQNVEIAPTALTLPNSCASLTRWASPPEIVVDDWPSLR